MTLPKAPLYTLQQIHQLITESDIKELLIVIELMMDEIVLYPEPEQKLISALIVAQRHYLVYLQEGKIEST
ncbi:MULTISPECIES: hypothetical protein [unclassified Paraflavitalea]|uniref:hypothetical protein n=1 Tax=unclassified Paraflavitalea TaxID=2798305 RepID=UPI003D339A9D